MCLNLNLRAKNGMKSVADLIYIVRIIIFVLKELIILRWGMFRQIEMMKDHKKGNICNSMLYALMDNNRNGRDDVYK